MSTRYSTYFSAPLSERSCETNKHGRTEPLPRSNQSSRVAGSLFGGLGSTIRRPLNDQLSVQPAVVSQTENLKVRVTARDLMTPCAATLRPEDSIERAARLMSETDSGLIPVVDAVGRLIGIITDRDIAVKLIALGVSIPHAQVSDCMIGEAFACSADSSLESCISAMSWHQLKQILIVDDEHRVVGCISRSDLACYLGEHPQKVEEGAMADILWALAS
jgi:CBS domain-containing protein